MLSAAPLEIHGHMWSGVHFTRIRVIMRHVPDGLDDVVADLICRVQEVICVLIMNAIVALETHAASW